MSEDHLAAFRKASRASEIVRQAQESGMSMTEIATALRISVSGMVWWRKHPDSTIEDERTARALRRLWNKLQPRTEETPHE